jgi:hypothetical protein
LAQFCLSTPIQARVLGVATRCARIMLERLRHNKRKGAAQPSREGAGDPKKGAGHLKRGAGKTGCALHPRSRVQLCAKETHTSIQVQRRQSGLPCAMALRLISCSPRRPGFLAAVASVMRSIIASLTPASGRQDHTTSPYAASPLVRAQKARDDVASVHRIPSRVRDDRDTPLRG